MHRLSEIQISRARVNLANRILENTFGCNPEPLFNNCI